MPMKVFLIIKIFTNNLFRVKLLDMDLTKEQLKIQQSILDWYKDANRSSHITLGGYAGTGKTTLTAALQAKLKEITPSLKIAFVSYTGKAARVLRQKLTQLGALSKEDFCGTIHSLIYSPITNDTDEIVGWEKRNDLVGANIIIVDEASMIDEEIWYDLLSYRVPIIAVGDHGQLPPIKGTFNLMQKPDLILTEIHRQSKDSPIIFLSILAREEGKIPVGIYGTNIIKYNKFDENAQEIIGSLLQKYNSNTLVLTGYNSTRQQLNQHLRQNFGFESSEPRSGDRVICIRNNHEKKIYNGMLGVIRTIEAVDQTWYFATIELDDEEEIYKGQIAKDQFGNSQALNFTNKRGMTAKGDLFDFGYALTVHKAQGSQANRVILFEERFQKTDDDTWRKWLYTAVTRAEEELFIIGTD